MACSARTPATLSARCPSASGSQLVDASLRSIQGPPLPSQLKCRNNQFLKVARAYPSKIQCQASPKKTAPTAESSLPVKAAFYASEAFGQVVSFFRPKKEKDEEEDADEEVLPLSHKEVVALLRADYDRSYFVTGDMTTRIYDKDCEFADPFASFRGLYRFKRNVSNLGSFMEEANLTITDWEESENKIAAKWRFKCVLGLPWRPILAASGGTEHYFDPTSKKIVKHVESWDISPADGLRQLVKPNPKRKQQR